MCIRVPVLPPSAIYLCHASASSILSPRREMLLNPELLYGYKELTLQSYK